MIAHRVGANCATHTTRRGDSRGSDRRGGSSFGAVEGRPCSILLWRRPSAQAVADPVTDGPVAVVVGYGLAVHGFEGAGRRSAIGPNPTRIGPDQYSAKTLARGQFTTAGKQSRPRTVTPQGCPIRLNPRMPVGGLNWHNGILGTTRTPSGTEHNNSSMVTDGCVARWLVRTS